MHSQHADKMLVGGRERAEPHERERAGGSSQPDEFGKQFACTNSGIDDAATAVNNWAFRVCNQFNRPLNCLLIALKLRLVCLMAGTGRC